MGIASRTMRAARVIGAVLLLAVILIGIPIVLVLTAGWPLPRALPSLDRMVTAVRQGEVPGEVVIKTLAVVVWLAWIQLTWAAAWELFVNVPKTARGQRTRPAPLVADTVSSGIGRLVAIVLTSGLLSGSAPADAGAPAPLTATSPDAVAAAVVDEPLAQPSPVREAPTRRPIELTTKWKVGQDDTLWAIAEYALGDGSRVGEILELNPRVSVRTLRADQVLRLPSDARVRADRSVQPAAVANDERRPSEDSVSANASTLVVDAPEHVPAERITIELGDDLWTLAEERLATAGVDDPAQTVAYLERIVDANASVVEDPDLIYAGEQFRLPAIGTPETEPSQAHGRPPRPDREKPDRPTVTPAKDRSGTTPSTTSTPTTQAPTAPTTTSVSPQTTLATDASTTSTSIPRSVPPPDDAEPDGADAPSPSPSPVGLGEAAMLSAGVLALLAARRRARLRAARPRARVPGPRPDSIVTERLLRTVDAGERLLRVDIAVRAAAASLVDGSSQIAAVLAASDGAVELVLTGPGRLPPPWRGADDRWTLRGSTPIEALAGDARSVGAPCVALVEIGVADDGRDVLVDLEAIGVLSVDADDDGTADVVINGIAASLTSSLFAASANVIAVGIDDAALLGHPRAAFEQTVDGALELAATLIGTTAVAKHTTFSLRARHTSGEAWEPAIVIIGTGQALVVGDKLAPVATRRRRGVAAVTGAPVAGSCWTMRIDDGRWVLDPLGIGMTPVGLRANELAALNDALEQAAEPLADDEDAPPSLEAEPSWNGDASSVNGHREPAPAAPTVDEFTEPVWSLLVRLLGPIEVVDRAGQRAPFDRSKAGELVAWLSLHRDHPTRGAARTALWELDVRDSTFANIVSDARRAMARLVEPPPGEEWLGRTLTEVLPLHCGVVSDADLVRARLDHARLQSPEMAIATLRPAVELIRDLPFSGTGYLWPDAEGITSNLVLLATSAAGELAAHHLSLGDVEGVFWATGQGLRVLPGHEELIAQRMRAHAQAGDLAGVRHEWESYERVLSADPWSDGAPAEKLAVLRRELLS